MELSWDRLTTYTLPWNFATRRCLCPVGSGWVGAGERSRGRSLRSSPCERYIVCSLDKTREGKGANPGLGIQRLADGGGLLLAEKMPLPLLHVVNAFGGPEGESWETGNEAAGNDQRRTEARADNSADVLNTEYKIYIARICNSNIVPHSCLSLRALQSFPNLEGIGGVGWFLVSDTDGIEIHWRRLG